MKSGRSCGDYRRFDGRLTLLRLAEWILHGVSAKRLAQYGALLGVASLVFFLSIVKVIPAQAEPGESHIFIEGPQGTSGSVAFKYVSQFGMQNVRYRVADTACDGAGVFVFLSV